MDFFTRGSSFSVLGSLRPPAVTLVGALLALRLLSPHPDFSSPLTPCTIVPASSSHRLSNTCLLCLWHFQAAHKFKNTDPFHASYRTSSITASGTTYHTFDLYAFVLNLIGPSAGCHFLWTLWDQPLCLWKGDCHSNGISLKRTVSVLYVIKSETWNRRNSWNLKHFVASHKI